jgi:hypothetical protein
LCPPTRAKEIRRQGCSAVDQLAEQGLLRVFVEPGQAG